MSKTFELVGYGKYAGEKREATVIKNTATILVAEVVKPDGAKQQIKFNKADGMAIGAKGDDGYRLPNDLNVKVPTAATTGEKKERVVKDDPNPERKCFCGCGAQTAKGSRFIPGHDAKAHSAVNKFLRGQLTEGELAIASPYIQGEVAHKGGWNSQVDPSAARKAERAAAAAAAKEEKEKAAADKKAAKEAAAAAKATETAETVPDAEATPLEATTGVPEDPAVSDTP